MLKKIKSKLGIECFPEVLLQSDRLIIRPPHKKDFLAWAQLRSVSREFIQPFDPLWAEDALSQKSYLKRLKLQAREWNSDRGIYFFIFDRTSGDLVGGVNLNQVVRGIAQMASAGYWVGKPFARQGYMSEALKIILDYAFDDIGLNRIYAGCVPENIPSQRVLRKLGFDQEGYAKEYLKINGMWQDHVLFGMAASRWRENKRILLT